MHSSGDTDVSHLVSECELTLFLMYTLLVTKMWPVLFQNVSCPGSNLHFLVTHMWPVLFQDVSWPEFQCALCW